MITLTCTHCKTTIEMDEAFAGGVCRCRHCGAIQTVPRSLKTGAAPAGAAKPGRTLYAKSPADAPIPEKRAVEEPRPARAAAPVSTAVSNAPASGAPRARPPRTRPKWVNLLLAALIVLASLGIALFLKYHNR